MDFITIFRDKFLLEREKILNEYDKENQGDDEYYYVYSKSMMLEDGYNLCSCKEGKSSEVILLSRKELPELTHVGCIIVKTPYGLIYDEYGTNEISSKIDILIEELLDEQEEYLKSKRIENHIYEVYEKNNDRIWLFDITENGYEEEIEEIEFPLDLLENAEKGDKFIFKDNSYSKY